MRAARRYRTGVASCNAHSISGVGVTAGDGPGIEGCQTVEEAIEQNTALVTRTVQENPVVQANSTKVVSAFYDIQTGEVSWGDTE